MSADFFRMFGREDYFPACGLFNAMRGEQFHLTGRFVPLRGGDYDNHQPGLG